MSGIRGFVAVSLLVAMIAAVGLRHVGDSVRDHLRGRTSVSMEDVRAPVFIEWSEADAMLPGVAAALAAGSAELTSIPARFVDDVAPRAVFLTISDGDGPALVRMGTGHGVVAATERALAAIQRHRGSAFTADTVWIKFDVVESVGGIDLCPVDGDVAFERSLEGIAFEGGSGVALLAEEVVAHSLISAGRIRLDRIGSYLEAGRGGELPKPDGGTIALRRFLCASFFHHAGRTESLFRGSRDVEIVYRDDLVEAARDGGDYLERMIRGDGSFVYRYHPKQDEEPGGYNMLRHAGTLYSMYELYGITGDTELLRSCVGPREYLLRHIETTGSGVDARSVVVSKGAAKLGGIGLAAIALAKRSTVTGRRDDDDLLRQLGRAILHHQRESGEFEYKWSYPEGEPYDFVSEYYPGEAILALLRIHDLFGGDDWLDAAERAALWLIETRDAGLEPEQLNHDHWLLYGLNELYRVRPDDRYLEHASRIARAITAAQTRDPIVPDYLGTYHDPPRTTPVATRTEGLVAAYRLLRDHGRAEQAEEILETICLNVLFQLRNQFRPSSTIHLPRPRAALGGFRRSLTDFEIRIDYVQHCISALLAVHDVLREERRDGIGRTGRIPVVLDEPED